MNFTQGQMLVLADAFGLIARGAKKIRGVLVEAANNEPVNSAPPPEEVSESSDAESESRSETTEQVDDSILKEDFFESATKYLYSKQMIWSNLSATAFFRNMARQRLRVNNLKFCWVHTGGSRERENWKKVSSKTAEDIYGKIRDAWFQLLDDIREHDKKPKDIRSSKWSRKADVLACVFPKRLFQKKGFKQILVDLHDDLPCLK